MVKLVVMTESDAWGGLSEQEARELIERQGGRREENEERNYPLSQFSRGVVQQYRELILEQRTVKISKKGK